MFDDEEQNQDETTPLPARLRFAYRLMGLDPDSDRQLGGSPAHAMQQQGGTPEMRAMDGDQSRPRLQQEPRIPRKLSIGRRLMQRDAAPVQRADGNRSSGIATGMAPPLPVIGGTRSSSVLQRKPQTPRKLSIGQRLMGLDAASGQRGNGRSGIATKLTIGQRLMGLDGRGGFSVGNPQARQGTVSGPARTGAAPGSLELTGNRWLRDGQSAFALGQQAAPISRPTGSVPVADMTAQTRARSRIPQPVAIPDVKPDLRVTDPTQLQRSLRGVMRGFPEGGRTVNLENPLGINVNPELAGHRLPDNPGAELVKLLDPQQWQKVSQADKTKLAALVSENMSAANDYAKGVLAGKPRPASAEVAGSRYFGPEIDNLIHSPEWIDGRLTPAEKVTLASLIKENDREGATALAKRLQQILWSGKRYAELPKTVAGRVNQAAQIAQAYQYNKRWIVEGERGRFRKGTDKCNQFVSDVLSEAGLEAPARHSGLGGPIGAAEWANASQKRIGHWQIVSGPPQPGDVISMITGYDPNTNQPWAHVGVVVENGKTASADTTRFPPGTIRITQFGFRPEEKAKRIVRRYVP